MRGDTAAAAEDSIDISYDVIFAGDQLKISSFQLRCCSAVPQIDKTVVLLTAACSSCAWCFVLPPSFSYLLIPVLLLSEPPAVCFDEAVPVHRIT